MNHVQYINTQPRLFRSVLFDVSHISIFYYKLIIDINLYYNFIIVKKCIT